MHTKNDSEDILDVFMTNFNYFFLWPEKQLRIYEFSSLFKYS